MVRLLDGSMSSQLLRFGYDCNVSVFLYFSKLAKADAEAYLNSNSKIYNFQQQENKPHWSFPANADMELMENVYKS